LRRRVAPSPNVMSSRTIFYRFLVMIRYAATMPMIAPHMIARTAVINELLSCEADAEGVPVADPLVVAFEIPAGRVEFPDVFVPSPGCPPSCDASAVEFADVDGVGVAVAVAIGVGVAGTGTPR
jgi:hypothetical protein